MKTQEVTNMHHQNMSLEQLHWYPWTPNWWPCTKIQVNHWMFNVVQLWTFNNQFLVICLNRYDKLNCCTLVWSSVGIQRLQNPPIDYKKVDIHCEFSFCKTKIGHVKRFFVTRIRTQQWCKIGKITSSSSSLYCLPEYALFYAHRFYTSKK